MKVAVVSLHDVAPGSRNALPAMLEVVGDVPLSLLVIPGPWRGVDLGSDPRFTARLRGLAREGHEIVLHGWEHRAPSGSPASAGMVFGRVLARGCEEFWALDEEEARRRITLGRSALARAGLRASGFVAPGWLASPESVRVAAECGVEYVTSHVAVTDLLTGTRKLAPAVSQRPGGASERVAASAASGASLLASFLHAPVRVAVHPADVESTACTRSIRRIISRLHASGYEFLTYGRLVERMRGSESIRLEAAA